MASDNQSCSSIGKRKIGDDGVNIEEAAEEPLKSSAVMASDNRSCSSLGKRKIGDDGMNIEEAAEEPLKCSSGNHRKIPIALPFITTNVKPTCKRSSTTETEDKKKLGNFEEEEEELFLTTPKSEKHKILTMNCCPPAPIKPRSTPRKRKPAISPRALYIPSDFPRLDLLFDSDSSTPKHNKKRQKT